MGHTPDSFMPLQQQGPLIPNAETEQLVWDAEQSLRALQDRLVEPGDLRALRRLLDNLETQQ